MGTSKEVESKLAYEGFKSAEIHTTDVLRSLEHAKKNRIFTGIKVIDDVFGGILPTDMVLLGAKTGAGKTALASQIALNGRDMGKNVYMFALEAEENEIQMRILYSLVVQKAKAINPRKRYNFKHWRMKKYDDLNCFYDECLESVDHFKNLHIYYRTKSFGIDDFIKETMAIKETADLVIIDHIHYFDLEGDNENRAMSEAIRKMRDINLLSGVPFIVIAHLRKGSTYAKIVPDLDDFMGSSDLSKVCTKAVILAVDKFEDGVSETYFHFPKFRGFSVPSRYIFKASYNINLNAYAPTYAVAKFTVNGPKFNFMENLADDKDMQWLG